MSIRTWLPTGTFVLGPNVPDGPVASECSPPSNRNLDDDWRSRFQPARQAACTIGFLFLPFNLQLPNFLIRVNSRWCRSSAWAETKPKPEKTVPSLSPNRLATAFLKMLWSITSTRIKGSLEYHRPPFFNHRAGLLEPHTKRLCRSEAWHNRIIGLAFNSRNSRQGLCRRGGA